MRSALLSPLVQASNERPKRLVLVLIEGMPNEYLYNKDLRSKLSGFHEVIEHGTKAC